MAQQIQERLKKLEEEKERLRKEEEEKQRKIDEAIRAREEKERLERERKEREKQKKKARIEKQKQEGTYLTAKQKEEMRIAQQKLEALRSQGIDIPALSAEKAAEAPKSRRVIYDNKAKKKKQQQDKAPGAEGDVTAGAGEDAEAEAGEGGKLSAEVEEANKEIGAEPTAEEDAAMAESDVKDDWAEEDAPEDWELTVDDDWQRDKELEELTGQTAASTKPETKAPAKVTPQTSVEKKEGKVSTTQAAANKKVSAQTSVEKKAEEEEEESDDESDSDDDDDESDSDDSESEEESVKSGKTDEQRAREKAEARIKKRRDDAEAARTTENLRCPIVCVLGHVDTGKTKILDKLRHTNVQDNEAGGITQQIGATNVPKETILEQAKMVKDFAKLNLRLPGLLIIDTPGHESFSNLRSRGSSLCDIAILVVDIMHGLEPQTIESINLLKKSKTPFVIALNKVDRLFQWQTNPHSDVVNTLKKQKPNTKVEFDERSKGVLAQMSEQGFNAALFYENKNPREYISMVPTSAHTGDGMGNLIALVCELAQKFLATRLMYSDELQASVMEVKAIQGLGTTLDVILVNGKLREGETIILPGTEGPIVTQIRGLLLPAPLREMRVKGNLEHMKEVTAAQGVKIIAKDLDKSLPGLPLYATSHDDEVPIYRELVARNLKDILSSFKVQDHGVFVQASTLGSLEALLEFLRTSKIPYAGISIGPVHKKDVTRCSAMLEHDSQWAVIMAFDVRVEREAQELADSLGVRIFTAEIIYHLFDKFTKYREELKRQKQEQFQNVAVFPCKLRVLPQYIFNSRDPIVMGVVVEAGFVKHGTPICVPSKEFVELGRVTSIEVNHKNVDKATTGQEVCIKIENMGGDAPKMYGRHFDHTDMLVSKISRDSIDAVKDWFRDEMSKTDWQLIVELKKLFQIT